MSIDEAFLKVGGLRRIWGSPSQVATRLRRDVLDRVGLPISVGVARTKFLAKVASSVAKPDGLLVVPVDSELDFLHPLAVDLLWGVGRVTATKLRERGISTVRQVAHLAEKDLVELLGQAAGRHVHALSHNRDPRPVRVRRRSSMGAQRALGRGPQPIHALETDLVGLVDGLGRLRAADRLCQTVTLRIRFDDFTRATRSHTLPEPTAHTKAILGAARELLAKATPMIQRRGITLIGVTLSGMREVGSAQLELPVPVRSALTVDVAVDRVRDKFGSSAVTRAVLLDRSQRPSVPLLPD